MAICEKLNRSMRYIHKSTWKTLLCFREDMEKCRFKCALFTVLCIGNKVIFFFILLNPFLKSEVHIDSQPMKTKWDNKTFQRSKSVAPNENTEITACVSFYCDYFFSLSLLFLSSSILQNELWNDIIPLKTKWMPFSDQSLLQFRLIEMECRKIRECFHFSALFKCNLVLYSFCAINLLDKAAICYWRSQCLTCSFLQIYTHKYKYASNAIFTNGK